MRFGIWTILYVMALVAAALATFGVGGLLVATAVLAFWAIVFYSKTPITETLAILLIAGLLFMCLFPALPSAREAARRVSCISNMKQLLLALHVYHDVHGTFPPAYVADESGKPMHSWRVLILPYLERSDLYKAYDFEEPWDGPNNSKLADVTIDVFKCPSAKDAPTHTNYMAVVGPQTAWPESGTTTPADFRDGTSKTILLVEVHDRNVSWLEPRDLSFDEAVAELSAAPQPGTRVGHQPADTYFFRLTGGLGHTVGFADGRVGFCPLAYPPEQAAARFTIAGGEPLEDVEFGEASHIHYKVKWTAVYTVALFVLIALLPTPWAWRQRHPRGSHPRSTGEE